MGVPVEEEVEPEPKEGGSDRETLEERFFMEPKSRLGLKVLELILTSFI